MVTQSEFNALDKRVGTLEATIKAAGGLVGRSLCDQREKAVMKAVDGLTSETRDLREEAAKIRREATNYRVQRLVHTVGILAAAVSALILLALKLKGGD